MFSNSIRCLSHIQVSNWITEQMDNFINGTSFTSSLVIPEILAFLKETVSVNSSQFKATNLRLDCR